MRLKNEGIAANVFNALHILYLSHVFIKTCENRYESNELTEYFITFVRKLSYQIAMSLLVENNTIFGVFVEYVLRLNNNDMSKIDLPTVIGRQKYKCLRPQDCIALMKAMLLHITTCACRGKFKRYEPNKDDLKYMCSATVTERAKMVRKGVKGADKKARINDLVNYLLVIVSDFNNFLLCLNGSEKSKRVIFIKWIYTLLYSYRGINPKIKITLKKYKEIISTIIATSETSSYKKENFDSIFPDIDEVLNRMIPGDVKFNKLNHSNLQTSEHIYVSGKAGPNGAPALLYYPVDAKALENDKSLKDSVCKLGEKIGISGLDKTITELASSELPERPSEDNEDQEETLDKTPIHSKLMFWSEPGGKFRIVAECDSISQSVLTPIHDTLSKVSKNLTNTSAHYDQSNAIDTMYKLITESKFCGTVDLRAATDLVSADLQSQLIDKIMYKIHKISGIGELWLEVVRNNRNFSVPKAPEGGLQQVKYKIGQPMGAKSSWVALHITMLALAYQAEIKAERNNNNFENQNHFSICGDDCLFADKQVFNHFKILCKQADLKINEEKSFECNIHDSESQIMFGEYLKKIFIDDEIFIPFSGRTGGAFWSMPFQQIYNYIKLLMELDLDYDLSDLINYSIESDRNFYTSEKFEANHVLTGDDISRKALNQIEALWYWFVLPGKLGGMNMEYTHFKSKFIEHRTMIDLVHEINQHIYFTKNAYCEIIISKIRANMRKAQTRSDKAILQAFTKKGLRFLNKTMSDLNKSSSLDQLDLTEKFELEHFNKWFNLIVEKFPVFRTIFKILCVQKGELLNHIEDLSNRVDDVQQKEYYNEYSDTTVISLEKWLKESKKGLVVVDFNQLLENQKDPTNQMEVSPVSSYDIKLYKENSKREIDIQKKIMLTKIDSDFLDF